MQNLQPDATIQGGKYRIERVLGHGGFGITYLARNTVFDVNAAIKEFFMKDENDRDGSMVTTPHTIKTELLYGYKYEGGFLNGEFHGTGTWYYVGGGSEKCKYNNGKEVK